MKEGKLPAVHTSKWITGEMRLDAILQKLYSLLVCAWNEATGWNLGYLDITDTPAPKTSYGEAISLFALIITNAIALTIALRGSFDSPPLPYMLLYTIVCVSALGGMVIMQRAETSNGPPNRPNGLIVAGREPAVRLHAFDKGSIMFVRWLFCCGVLIAVGFVWLAYRNELPGQGFTEKVKVKLDKASHYEFKTTKQAGIEVDFLIGKTMYPRGVPSQLDGEIILGEQLAKKWTIKAVLGSVEAADEGEEMKHQPYLEDPNEKEPGLSKFYLEGLQSNKEYRLKIYLHPSEGATKDRVLEAMASIDEGNSLRVFLFSKKTR